MIRAGEAGSLALDGNQCFEGFPETDNVRHVLFLECGERRVEARFGRMIPIPDLHPSKRPPGAGETESAGVEGDLTAFFELVAPAGSLQIRGTEGKKVLPFDQYP